MLDFSGLRNELSIWDQEGLKLPFWWRDDDAIEVTGPLDRLCIMAESVQIPVHLAIIPANATQELEPYLEGHCLRGVVHGWCHRNTAPDGQKRSEFGYMRKWAPAELERGLRHLRRLYGPLIHPMFVPPWNRIAPELVAVLDSAGYSSISTYLPRNTRMTGGIVHINTHIDPIDWSASRSLALPEQILSKLVTNLQERRRGRTDATEPLGLLTHHLAHDDAIWDFTSGLLDELRRIELQIFDIADTKDLP